MTRRQQRKAKKVQARQRRLRNERHISLTLAAQQRKATSANRRINENSN